MKVHELVRMFRRARARLSFDTLNQFQPNEPPAALAQDETLQFAHLGIGRIARPRAMGVDLPRTGNHGHTETGIQRPWITLAAP